MFSIAIVGGGLSGTVTAIKIMQAFDEPVHISLFERTSKQLYRGVAYSSSLILQPLNVRAGQMNIWGDKPGHFFKWLSNKPDPRLNKFDEHDFVNRHLFGDYLKNCFEDMVKEKPQHRVTVVYEEVSQIEKHERFVVKGINESIEADVVVLALGNFPPGDILKLDNAADKSFYVSNPWASDWLTTVQQDDEILFLGSGLTTIDQIVNLFEQGHRGKIHVMSRRGLIPLPHAKYHHVPVPPMQLKEGIELRDILRELRQRIDNSKTVDWRNFIDAIRQQVPAIWKLMSYAERTRFLRHVRPYWEIHRHRIPAETHHIITKKIETGQVSVLAGNLIEVIPSGKFAEAIIRPRAEQFHVRLRVSKIVNCTGPQCDFRKIEQPLIRDLSTKGWLQHDELNLGLAVNDDGQLISRDGSAVNNVYTIGPLRKGAMWECTALREISTQADQLTGKLKADFCSFSKQVIV